MCERQRDWLPECVSPLRVIPSLVGHRMQDRLISCNVIAVGRSGGSWQQSRAHRLGLWQRVASTHLVDSTRAREKRMSTSRTTSYTADGIMYRCQTALHPRPLRSALRPALGARAAGRICRLEAASFGQIEAHRINASICSDRGAEKSKQSEPATGRHVTGARHAPTAGGPAHTNTPDGDREVDAEILVHDAVDSPMVRTR